MKVFSSASRRFRLPLLLVLIATGVVARLSAASYYVDYVSGSDANAGTNSGAAWQHCPGDPAASGTAASASLTGGDTVYFKGGTTYVLTGASGIALNWSGSSSSTITYDGNSAGTWGSGRAVITDNYGSNGIAAFSANSAVSYLTFKSLEIGAVGGAASLPTDSGSTVAARYGAGLVFNGGASNTTIDGCVFHNLGYWFNQKPMSAASLNGAAIAMQTCSAVTISNCDFSYVFAGIELYSATAVDSLTVTNCAFHDSVCWTIDLPRPSVTPTNLSISGCTETNNTQFSSSSWTGYGLSPRTASVSVTSGSSVTLSVVSAASPAASYQWLKDGNTLSGATNATYTLASAATTDAGTYTVIATNTAGSTTSNDAILTVSVATVAPSITTQPASQTVTASNSVSFTVAASGTPTPTYQWYKDGVALSGSTSTTLTIASVASTDAGSYYAIATNSAGSATSNAATLGVTAATVAPTITTQPSSQTVNASSSVSFTVAASGTPAPTYQWYKDGSALSGATNATLTLSGVTSANAGGYSAVASNSAGSATSSTATLTVNTPVTAIAPTITTQPTNQTASASSTVTFTVAASGSPTPTYQWYKSGSAISGATNATLTLSSVTAADVAIYTAVATNSAGSATSNSATLTVTIVSTTTPPAITTQPASQTVSASSTVTFTVAASGSPTPTYQWYKDGSILSGATSSTLTLTAVSSGSAGSYTAVATNSSGSATSNAATLTVNTVSTGTAPTITTQPASQTAAPLGSVTFTVAASGSPTPTYQWYKNGVAIAAGTSASLTLTSLTTSDVATYVAVATNSAGSATSNGATLALSTASTTTAPTFTTQPVSKSATVGSTVSFSVVASGSPTPTIQWKKDGVALAGVTGSTLTLTSITTAAAGTYVAVATNSAGTATSNGASLTVTSSATAPVITTQPVSQTVALKSTVTFSVAASGSPTPTYQWYKDGFLISGATKASYSIRNVSKGNAGTYTAKARNIAGSVTSNGAVLSIGATTATSKPATAPDALSITTQPVSLNLAPGSTATFSVSATSTSPIYYQWMKNNVAVAGATDATLTLTNVSTTDAASYTVVVNDSDSSLTSDVAALAILPGTPTESRLVNLSVLSHAGTGYDTLIIGFAIDGGATKSLLVRGIGPTLGAFNVPGTLSDPVLSLYTGSTMLQSNTQWATSDDAALIPLVSSNLGAFGLSGTSADSVLLPSLPSGTYSVAVTGANSDTGLAMIELYDAAPTEAARLTNVSVRTNVGPSNSPTIGFVVKGNTTKKLLIRAVGPGLAQFNVDGVLADPQIDIFQKSVRIAGNDNWSGDAKLTTAFSQVGAFGLGDTQSKDAAMIFEAAPGEYSAVISSVDGASGIALVEVYELP